MLFKACFCDAGGSQENWQEIPSSTGNMSDFNSGEIPRGGSRKFRKGWHLREDYSWILGELGLNWEWKKKKKIEEGIHVNQLVG